MGEAEGGVVCDIAAVRRRRRRRPSIPANAVRIAEALSVFGLPIPTRFTSFHLIRRRAGAEVWANDTGRADGGYNLSALLNVWPKDFPAARQWVRAWGDANGHEMSEVRAVRRPTPPRESDGHG